MKTILTTISALVLLSACSSSSKNSLCDCVEKGAQVDAYAQSILMDPAHTQAQKDSLDILTAKRDEVCQEFIDIDPMELEKERAKCEGIQINRD